MSDISNDLQGGFTLTEYERTKLNDLKKTDPVTKHEFRRLQVLRETKLIEATDLEPLYKRYTTVIQKLFKVPIVVLALTDLETIYIKARAGLDGPMEAPRKGSPCNAILLEDSPLVSATADANRDARYSYCSLAWPEATPSNATPKSIHFYASVALVVDSVRIGSVCLIDCVPRPDLVDRAVRLLPDFGHIISDCMCRRHKELLGCSTELSELTMSVVYNLKYPMLDLQRSFDSLGQSVAFQPSLRSSRVPVYDGSASSSTRNSPVPGTNSVYSVQTTHSVYESPIRTTTITNAVSARSIECIPEEQSSSSSSAQPMSPASVTSNHAFSPVSSDSSSGSSKNVFSAKYDNNTTTTATTAFLNFAVPSSSTTLTTAANTAADATTATNTSTTTPTSTTPIQVPVRYQKVTNFDALRVEKDSLVDLLFEVRHRTMTLIKILAHSLSVAHDLQAQYHRQAEAAVSTSYTVNNTITSIAGRRPTDEACKERIHPAGKMHTRLQRMHTHFAESVLSKNEIAFTVDAALSCPATDPEAAKFQCSGRALTLCMYTTLYHMCRAHPGGKIDVNIRFEERDYTPLHVQLANRVSSPGGNRQYIHGGMHRLNSPNSSKTSTKSALDSGKLTRIPSFANNFTYNGTLSISSDGSVSESQQREIMLLHSRRSSLDDGSHSTSNTTANASNNTSNTTNTTNTANTTNTHAVHGAHGVMHSAHGMHTGANISSDKLYTVPAPINTNYNTNYYSSPRASLRKNSNPNSNTGKSNQVCGDIYLTFKVAVKPGSLRDMSDRADSFAKGDISGPDSDEDVPKSESFSFDSRVETNTFENVVLRNILSTAQGGFCSSTGSEYYPDPPNPILSSLIVFGGGGTRASGMTDGMNSLPSSLKMPPHEALSQVREDYSEGEYYTLTVRIPCNAYTSSTANASNMGSSTVDTAVHHDKKSTALSPIQSLRNFGSSSTVLNSSHSNSSSVKNHLNSDSSVSAMDSEGSPVPSLFNTNTTKFNTIKFKPSISIFSPRHPDAGVEDHVIDETVELPLRHKTDTGSLYSSAVRAKPKAGRSFGRSVTAMLSSVSHSLFGHSSVASGDGVSVSMRSGTSVTSGAFTTSGRSMRRVGDIRVTPTTNGN